jgi:hypothetical protein
MPSKKKQMTHLVQLVVVILLAIILRFSDPLSQNITSGDYVQHLVPTKMYITQLMDPLKSHFKDTLPSYFTMNEKPMNTKTEFEGSAKEFLSSKFFESDSDSYSAEFLTSISKNFVSPLTTTMMMMGCYGDIQRNTQFQATISSDSAVLFNVLLQTLEYNFGSSNDKSACSCLKDFANPLLASAKKQILVLGGELKDSESNHLHYDTCQSQNLQDFVYNGNYAEIGAELKSDTSKNPYISMSTDFVASTLTRLRTDTERNTFLGRRNREDPMLYELEQLLAKILKTNRGIHLQRVKSELADTSFSAAKHTWKLSLTHSLNKTYDQITEVEWNQKMLQETAASTEEKWKSDFKDNLNWTTVDEDDYILSDLKLSHIADHFPDFLPMFTNILHNHLQHVRQKLAFRSFGSNEDRDDEFNLLFYGDFDWVKHSNLYNSELDSLNMVYNNTHLIRSQDVLNYTVTYSFTWLREYIQDKMYAHNKLRAPIYTGDSSNVDSSSQPPTMDLSTYQNYMNKYAAAYKMCSFAGIPAYQTVPRHKIESTSYTHTGNAYLLYAVFIAFVYWNHQSSQVKDAMEQDDEISVMMPQKQDASTVNPKPNFLVDLAEKYLYDLFVFLIHVFFFIQLLLAQLEMSFNKLHVEYNNVEDHLKSPRIPLFAGIGVLSWIFFLVFIGSVLLLALKLYENRSKPLNRSIEIVAQIAMDVGLIAGFSTNGIAVFLQRGLGNEYLIVFVFLTLVVTAFLQHLSNVMRLLQQMNIKNEMRRAKYETLQVVPQQISRQRQSASSVTDGTALIRYNTPQETLDILDKQIEKHTGRNVGMNRTLAIMVIIILLAGIGFSASQTYDVLTYDVIYNYNHMWIFLGVVFFVLCAFDILHEVASFSGRAIHPYEQHSQKLLWTAWTLVLALLFLHFHQFVGLCASYEEFDAVEGDSKNLCNYPRFLFGNTFHMVF